jgi:RND family efflux transporter MFP subunit
MRIKSKKTFLILIVAVITFIIVNQLFFKEKELGYTLETVKKGNVIQEVSESGTVQMGESVNLSFKTGGTIKNIYVKVGDKVSSGQKLAVLDTTQLLIQLAQAQSNVVALEAKLSELQEGANSALKSVYDSTPAILNQAYNSADSVMEQNLSSLFIYRYDRSPSFYELTYENCEGSASTDVVSQRKEIKDNLTAWKVQLQNLSSDREAIDQAVLSAKNNLKSIQVFLDKLSDTLNTDCGDLTIEETDKIEFYKPVVTSAITTINSSFATVLSQEKAIVDQKLALQNYSAGNQEITYQEALVKEAKEGVALLEEQIQDASLFSPSDGQIATINNRTGETIQVTQSFINFIPDSPFEVTADIYEEDIVKVEVGDPVKISLTAFPDQILQGTVISIDPAAELIDGVVYFGIKIDIQNPPQGTRSGMSADIVIETDRREDVLLVSDSAITKKDGKFFVQVVNENNLEEKEIQAGLEGEDDFVEIIFGLQEGEQVAIFN